MADDDGTVRAWINSGKPNGWTSIGKINPPWTSVTGDMVRMADVDNDGRADMIALYKDGAAKVWKNTAGYKFEPLDSLWATGIAPRENVHFKDIDGDGYADYCVLSASGVLKWARNTHNNGKDQSKKNWETAVTIAPGPGGVPDNRARLYDLDGDGLVDYLVVWEGGAVDAYRNTGNLNDNGEGRNWDELGTIAPGISGVTGGMVRFADMDGDGQADFLAVAADGSIRMWKNMGVVGSKGASMRLADLTGDGKADIVSVDYKGRARAWLNKGLGQWSDIGEIAPGLNEDMSAATVEFADVNGDKLADFLVVYGTGAVKAYLNNGVLPKGPGDDGKRIWQEGISISEGVGEPGRKVRFADLNGDGYADYLILHDNGAVDTWLNRKNIPPKNGGRIWDDKRSNIATGVGEPGSKIRFADITGDGKDDYLIQYAGSATKAYNNTGNIPDIGRARNWADMGTVQSGVSPVGPVRFADIDGDGKDDYLVVFSNGAINAYINVCDWKAPEPGTGQPGTDINGDSSCADILKRGTGVGTFEKALWDDAETTPYWTWWLSYDLNANDGVPRAFASDWGITGVSCRLLGECGFPKTCSAYTKTKGSGRAHLIMTALNNMHLYYNAMYQAIQTTQDYFNTLQVVFEDYYPEPDLKDVGIEALLGITGFLWSVGTGMASSVISEESELLTELIGDALGQGISDALESNDEPLNYASDLAKYINSSASIIETMHSTLLKQGHYQGRDGPKVVLDAAFAHGRWLDSDKIPILSESEKPGVPRIGTSDLASWFFSFLHAAILDYAWKNSYVFVVGFKMTEQQFKDKAKDIDQNLKIYYQGRGYFLQSYEPYRSLGNWRFRYRDAPGHDSFPEEAGLTFRLKHTDAIKSSVETYRTFGYGYGGGIFLGDVIKNPSWQAWRDLKPDRAGAFTLPVCVVDELEDLNSDLDYFFERINDPGDSPHAGTLFCICKDGKDKNGKTFIDQMNLANDLRASCRPDTTIPNGKK